MCVYKITTQDISLRKCSLLQFQVNLGNNTGVQVMKIVLCSHLLGILKINSRCVSPTNIFSCDLFGIRRIKLIIGHHENSFNVPILCTSGNYTRVEVKNDYSAPIWWAFRE